MMKGIANPQLKAGGLQISRNGNGNTMNAVSHWRHSFIYKRFM